MRSESLQRKKKKVVSHQFLIAYVCVCVFVCVKWLQTHKERAEQHFFYGTAHCWGPQTTGITQTHIVVQFLP